MTKMAISATFLQLRQIYSHRKQAEASLHRQALTFENMHDGVIITDLTGNIIDCNPVAQSMFGYTKAEILAKVQLFSCDARRSRSLSCCWYG
jgi:PAS domain-containing protein